MAAKRFYIYGLFYTDDEGDEVCFYIGKGSGYRAQTHLSDSELAKNKNVHKDNKIRKLIRNGREPQPLILAHKLSEQEALELERRLLRRDQIFDQLTNIQRGGAQPPVYEGEDNHFYGKNHTLESRRKISENNGARRLTKKEIAEIKWLLNTGDYTQTSIGEVYGIKPAYTSEIANGHKSEWVKPQKPKQIPQDLKGPVQPVMKLSERQATEVKLLAHYSEMTQSQIAEEYNIHQSTVSDIKRGKRWAQINI